MDIRAKNKKVWARSKPFFPEMNGESESVAVVEKLDDMFCCWTYGLAKPPIDVVNSLSNMWATCSTRQCIPTDSWSLVHFNCPRAFFSSSSSSSSIFTLITGWYWILPAEHRQSPWPLFSFDFTALESAGRIVPFQTSPSEWIETLRAVLYTSFDKRRKKKRNQLVCVCVWFPLFLSLSFAGKFFFSLLLEIAKETEKIINE